MAKNDPQRRDAGQARRRDELALPKRQRLAANDARHIQPVDRADGDEDQQEISLEGHHQQDYEEDERQRVKRIDEPHHQGIDTPADEARDRPVNDADEQADEARHDRHDDRDPYAEHRPDEEVAAQVVGTE